MHLPTLIKDLAIMLLTAGIVTVIFKKIKQPLVLGYILAGFLISPYIPFLPTVTDTESIHTWSEIGIIVLMFCLGLEFNLHKLAQVGGTAIITALVEVAGMLFLGFLVGQLMGWSTMNSIFLGGMLSMSSTTIIIKAFDEMNLRKKRFAELVFGTLVIEDIAGIFMMIVLSTISVSQSVAGAELAVKLLLLVLYLVIWLILGILIVPTLLNKAADSMTDEILLILSLGICFGMVLLANALGFSSALGAFLAGSLLAGTKFAERVEHVSKGVKDLFGAVFFLSVGMMVAPASLAKYIVPILIITVVTIVGKLIFSTLGMLLSGQGMKTSLQVGFSLAQIGEFAFIIASLGISLGVTSDFLYSIVVCVSVITTITTPFLIKAADPVANWLEKKMPDKMKRSLSKFTDEEQSSKVRSNEWAAFFKRFFLRVCLFGALMAGVGIIVTRLIFPLLTEYIPDAWAKIICIIVILAGVAVFIRPMLDKNSPQYTSLWVKSRSFRLPLIVLTIVRYGLVVLIAATPIRYILGIDVLWILPVMVVAVIILARSKRIATSYLQFETRFMMNFNERLLNRGKENIDWLDEKLMVTEAGNFGTDTVGKSLIELGWGRDFGVIVVKIIRDGKSIILPHGREILAPGDKALLIGENQPLKNLGLSAGFKSDECVTLREFISSQEEGPDEIFCAAVDVEKNDPYANSTIRDSGIRKDWDCAILGLQRNGYPITQPDVEMKISVGDIIWVVGSRHMAEKMAGQERPESVGAET
ncbi:MAG: cation:proton antiporter [Oscillospiraceae bacterium]|nr:cation:proton antiporter [Oscillospiraceae bacterium]